ncbi:MAG TPA: cyclic nucleotide-binding domain-containing protein, partial [Bryobacterales bacterium]|nr:cyclic nucleotide-binding domain-containing protein [Bryobacterales bacterium]
MISRKVEALSRTSLLASLTPGEIEALALRAIEKRYAPGEMLFREGEECTGFYVLAQGSVKIVKTSPG